jgi:putative transcriptional regulator
LKIPVVAHDTPLDALLADYAAGRLSPELHSLVAAHLVLKRDNRSFVRALEDLVALEDFTTRQSTPAKEGVSARDVLSGRLQEGCDPGAAALREARLAAIFATAAPQHAPKLSPDEVLPAPLKRLLGRGLDTMAWRTVLPGIKEHRIAGATRSEASLVWVRAGRRMPAHSHEGSEITLVLKGGFRDATGHYRRGDIAFADAELDHHPLADADEDCVCFAVTDAPLRLTGPIGRLMQKIWRQ